jgi:HPr kinase/phosphorylase
MVEACETAGVALIATSVATTKLVSELTLYLEEKLAPVETVHGSLVDVFGVGVLLMGESGIGKSECALALLDKGHRLTADDVVEIRRTPEKALLGTGVRPLRFHMEIRGLGIVDIQSLYGARAVRERKLVELVVRLVPWETGKRYDRTGLEEQTHAILQVPLPLHVLPVKPGRNLAVLVEAAAMNWRLKQSGVNTAERLNEMILGQLAKDEPPSPGARSAAPSVRRKRHEER